MPQKSKLQKKPSPKSDIGRDTKKDKKKPSQSRQQSQRLPHDAEADQDENQIDISATIPLTLQQLLLNVFKSALLSTDGQDWNTNNNKKKNNDEDDNDKNQDTALNENENETETETEQTSSDIKSMIQIIKSHLYNRDFDSAFTDANEDILRAYALRWSASRALGYAGILKAMLKNLLFGDGHVQLENGTGHIVSIGGGAGAEIVALAAVWRNLMDESALADAVTAVSLNNAENATEKNNASAVHPHRLSVTAVDIADWSSVINRLSSTIRSPAVRGSKTHPAPLIQPTPPQSRDDDEHATSESFTVNFERADVLSLPDQELKGLISPGNTATIMVTLMFTLNELFSTSMAKTTAFLLHLTDLLHPGTVLLVVDSPGSYSTLTLGKGSSKQDSDNVASTSTSTSTSTSATQERRYPMKFLLDHTLLSVAKGKWERIYSQDSRWWRRDAARLGYDVGEGAGLEDMRFQVHIYRRLAN